jgi:hypothetical protein
MEKLDFNVIHTSIYQIFKDKLKWFFETNSTMEMAFIIDKSLNKWITQHLNDLQVLYTKYGEDNIYLQYGETFALKGYDEHGNIKGESLSGSFILSGIKTLSTRCTHKSMLEELDRKLKWHFKYSLKLSPENYFIVDYLLQK